MQMKLSPEAIIGIKRLCNPGLVSEEHFQKITEECIQSVVAKTNNEKKDLVQIFDNRLDIVKGAYASFAILLVECARYGIDKTALKTNLESCNINPQRMSFIINLIEKYKPDVRLQLSSLNESLLRLVDVHWRLDYCVKTNSGISKYQHLYHIDFVVRHPDKGQNTIRIVCTLQHLQELVYIFKNMVKYINRITNYTLK